MGVHALFALAYVPQIGAMVRPRRACFSSSFVGERNALSHDLTLYCICQQMPSYLRLLTSMFAAEVIIVFFDFSGSNAPALESLCDAPRHSFFQNESLYNE